MRTYYPTTSTFGISPQNADIVNFVLEVAHPIEQGRPSVLQWTLQPARQRLHPRVSKHAL